MASPPQRPAQGQQRKYISPASKNRYQEAPRAFGFCRSYHKESFSYTYRRENRASALIS
jgi:hypothetical protein